MVDLMVSRGGQFKQFDVERIQHEGKQVSLSGSAGTITADKVIVAAGAWSRSLAEQLGDSVPLDTERGYHLMLPESTRDLLNAPVVNGESSFVLSPMETGMRLSSQIEFGGLVAAPDYSRVRSLLPLAKRMLPTLDTREQSAWMGFRPSLPDSLPVLGFSTNSKNVLYAFGHQHLGMTMGAVTGKLVSDLIAGTDPIVDMAPFRPNRF
jgi:glycine/D-amino acid oxidase-like deaminating enzyme